MTLVVRESTLSDVDLIAPLFDAYRQFYALPSNPTTARHYIATRLRLHDSVIFLATENTDTALGFTQLYPTLCSLALRPYAILSDLFVSPTARRQGVGKLLLERAHTYARDTGLDRLELQTARANHAAQALYESLGWTRDDIFSVYTWRSA